MSFGTPAQQQLGQKFFAPFFRWPDDAALRAWLQEQSPDELEQFLGWFDLSNRRDRETLGRQELRKLRNPDTKIRALLSDGRALLSGRDPVNTHSEFEVIAHPTPAIGSAGSLTASTKRMVSNTEARLAFAVLTTERKAA